MINAENDKSMSLNHLSLVYVYDTDLKLVTNLF